VHNWPLAVPLASLLQLDTELSIGSGTTCEASRWSAELKSAARLLSSQLSAAAASTALQMYHKRPGMAHRRYYTMCHASQYYWACPCARQPGDINRRSVALLPRLAAEPDAKLMWEQRVECSSERRMPTIHDLCHMALHIACRVASLLI
jgi:hypothetical protein